MTLLFGCSRNEESVVRASAVQALAVFMNFHSLLEVLFTILIIIKTNSLLTINSYYKVCSSQIVLKNNIFLMQTIISRYTALNLFWFVHFYITGKYCTRLRNILNI